MLSLDALVQRITVILVGPEKRREPNKASG